MYSGPKTNNSGLVWGYDIGFGSNHNFDHRVFPRRHSRGKPTTNFYSDGHFPGGNGMSSEDGSNPTNTIVELANPGLSKYVLQQTMGSASTEYQINLTTELASSTTYCLSGWYAESSDYDGSERMFHCRAYSSGGSHQALGAGLYNVIETKIVNGITWRYCYATITTPSDYNNSFNWYVGYNSDSYNGARYYTNLKMEVGSIPTPYIDGIRTNTQSLINLAKGGSDINVGNASFHPTLGYLTFDGTDDSIGTGMFSGRNPSTNPFTVEAVVKADGANGMMWVDVDGNGSNQRFYSSLNTSTRSNFGIQGSPWSSGTPIDYFWHHQVIVMDGSTARAYDNGTQIHTKSYTSYTLNSGIRVGSRSGSSYFWSGDIPVFKIYNRALSPREVAENYRAYKSRFHYDPPV